MSQDMCDLVKGGMFDLSSIHLATHLVQLYICFCQLIILVNKLSLPKALCILLSPLPVEECHVHQYWHAVVQRCAMSLLLRV